VPLIQQLEQIRSQLAPILKERDDLFPKRDPQNTARMNELVGAYVDAVTRIQRSESNWSPDETLIREAASMAERPAFICGYMKSGTTFLTSLLDGHPEVTALPGDSRMVYRIRTRRDVEYTQRIRQQRDYWLGRFINPRGQKPFWFLGTDDRAYVEFAHYLSHWLDHLPQRDRSPFLAVVLTLHCANPARASQPKIWVEKTTGNEMRVSEILKLFPAARFIHIVRDPMALAASVKRFYRHRGREWHQGLPGAMRYILAKVAWRVSGRRTRISVSKGPLPVTLDMYRSFRAAAVNQDQLGPERYHVLRYEDLITDPEAETRKLASFLEVEWDASLLTPTSNGRPTASNSMYDDRRPARGQILTQRSKRWRKELSRYEQRIIRFGLRRIAKKWGYDLE